MAFAFRGVHAFSLPHSSSVIKWSETMGVSEFLT